MKKITLFILIFASFFATLITFAQGGCDIPTSNLIFTGITTPLTITQTGSTTSCDPQTVQLCSSVPARSSAIYGLTAFTSANSIAKFTTNFTSHTLVRDNSYTGPSSGNNYAMDRNPITGEVFIIKESSGRRLFTLDLATNTMVAKGLVLSTLGSNLVVDFTFDNNGIMYATFNNGTIQKINYNNPALTPTAFAVGLPTSAAGLTYDFDANRLLYSTGTTNMSLYQISSVGTVGLLFTYSFANSGQGIEYVGNNVCYVSGTSGDVLYRLNLITHATTTVLTPTLFSSTIKDLMYVPGVSLQWSNPSGNLGTTTCINVTPSSTTPYTLSITNDFGCSNLATYSVTVGAGVITTNGSVTQTQCGGSFTWPLPFGTGLTYTASQNITNTVGCNTATLNLTINNSSTNGSLSITASGSYTWSGSLGSGLTYTTSGVYTNTTTNAAGCPNVATLNLVITVNTFTVGSSCGATISGLSVTINTPIVIGASSYTFRLKNMVTNVVQTIVRPVNSFALSNLVGVTLGTLYQIEVSTNGGVSYGPPCLVNTPSPTSTIEAQCGTTLTSMTQYVYCSYYASITGYRFRVTNTATSAVQIVDSGLNRFSFSQISLPMRTFGTTYFVEVALQNTDGTYLPYSAGCSITTALFPTTRIRPLQCNYTAISYVENFAAVIVSGASEYRFNLYNTSLGYNSVLDRPVNTFNFTLFSGLLPGTQYTVQVAVKIDGNWGPYGALCNITTPGIAKTSQVVSNEFKAIAYPNPFAENVMFNVKTSSESTIQIRVYDMLGKQIENRNVAISEIENLQIGANYPPGVYNVIVSQDDTTKNLRVIKR